MFLYFRRGNSEILRRTSKAGMTPGLFDTVVLFPDVASLQEAYGYSICQNEKKRDSFLSTQLGIPGQFKKPH